MARRKATGGTASGDKVKAGEVMKMPGASLVKEAAGDLKAARSDGGLVTTALRDAMAAHKTAGIHPRAVKLVEASLSKAKGSDRGLAAEATFWAHVDYYRDVLGLTELLKKQGEMFQRPEAGEADNVDDEIELEGAAANGGSEPDEPDLRPTHLRNKGVNDDPTSPRKH